MSETKSPFNTYLIFDDYHIISFKGFSPDQLKEAAKSIIKNPNKHISYNTILNGIVKMLGFKGGFSNYQNENYNKLLTFLDDNQLIEYENYLDKYSSKLIFMGNLRLRLSERLFLSNNPLPEKLLLGQIPFDFFPHDDWLDPLLIDIFQNHKQKSNNQFFDSQTFLNAFFTDASDCLNFLSDAMFLPEINKNYIPKLYWLADTDKKKINQGLQKAIQNFRLIKKHLINIDKLWFKIIPFNDNLIFIKNGSKCDFVIRNQRTKIFDRKYPEYCNYNDLNNEQLAMKFFNEWYYFKKDLWKEPIEHEAENYHYKNGGKMGYHYPGVSVITKKYMEDKDLIDYSRKKKRRHKHKILPGFKKEILKNGKVLYISNLISIKDFFEFFKATDYNERRRKDWYDDVFRLNCEKNKTLPAAVTWYDANAYASWFSNKYDIPCRMITLAESEEIFPDYDEINNQIEIDDFKNWCIIKTEPPEISNGKIKFVEYQSYLDIDTCKPKNIDIESIKGSLLEIHNYSINEMEKNHSVNTEGSFYGEKTFYLFNLPLKWIIKNNGLQFICQRGFAEWIDTENIDSQIALCLGFHQDKLTTIKESIPFHLWDYLKYQSGISHSAKIGFRICYESN